MRHATAFVQLLWFVLTLVCADFVYERVCLKIKTLTEVLDYLQFCLTLGLDLT